MSASTDERDLIAFKPAERVVGLYALGAALAVVCMTYLVRLINEALGVDESLLIYPWLAVLLMACVVVVYAYIWRFTTHYSMTATHITAIRGILAKEHLRIPLSRVTNYWIKRTFMERLLGLADLYIDTAGGNEVELIMVELTFTNAQSFYQILGELLKTSPAGAEFGSAGVAAGGARR